MQNFMLNFLLVKYKYLGLFPGLYPGFFKNRGFWGWRVFYPVNIIFLFYILILRVKLPIWSSY